MTFEKELEQVINRHSVENASNTPDFILAQYLSACLAAFATAIQQRETWYGRDARPGVIGVVTVHTAPPSLQVKIPGQDDNQP